MATTLKSRHDITVTPLSPAIGAEIGGIDLRRETAPEIARQIREAWYEHAVLLFRDQDISEDDQFRFACLFGEVAERVHPPVEKRDWRPDRFNKMQLVTDRLDEQGRRLGSLGHGKMWFHTDKCYVERPHRASLLYAMEIPSVGGHTRFANLYTAYDRVPPALKQKPEGRKVLQCYDYTKSAVADTTTNLDEILHYWQPIFVTNPDSGRKALYVCRLMTAAIEGMEQAESDAILEQLADIIETPDNVYEHAWRPGDLVIWDNLASVHARTDWPEDEPRSLRRCTINGTALY